jgi:hypothetical protein
MARPKRMGAYNALDDLLPGPAWDPAPAWDPEEPGEAPPPPRRPRLEPVPDLPRGPERGGPRGALDDLLPGPGGGAMEDLLPGPSVEPVEPVGPAPGRRGAGRHLAAWNPLDALPPGPGHDPVPAKARVSFRLPADLVETARDAVAHLAGTADRTTLTALAERALRAELARLAAAHNRGRPFPPRPGRGDPRAP